MGNDVFSSETMQKLGPWLFIGLPKDAKKYYVDGHGNLVPKLKSASKFGLSKTQRGCLVRVNR
jgi:hypothetical protein